MNKQRKLHLFLKEAQIYIENHNDIDYYAGINSLFDHNAAEGLKCGRKQAIRALIIRLKELHYEVSINPIYKLSLEGAWRGDVKRQAHADMDKIETAITILSKEI